MRTAVYLGDNATQADREAVRSALVEEGITVDYAGRSAVKVVDLLGVRVDFEFVLATTAGGVILAAERAALRLALRAARRLRDRYRGSQAITVGPSKGRRSVVYLVPDGEAGDLALDAIGADFEQSPLGGQRVWFDSAWMAPAEMLERLDRRVDKPE